LLERNFMPLTRQVLKLILALLAGGCVGALVMVGAAMVMNIPVGGTPQHSSIPNILIYLLVLTAFTIPVALLAGFPTFFILRRFRALNWLSVSLAGVAASDLAAYLFGARIQSVADALMFSGSGIAAALAAYVVVLRSNIPLNRDAPQAARTLA